MYNRLNRNWPLVIVSLIVLCSCQSKDLEKHLVEVNKVNSCIDCKMDWEVVQHYKLNTVHLPYSEIYYGLECSQNDTLYMFSFTFFEKENNLGFYHVSDLILSCFLEDEYIEMSILNEDTLYYFTTTDIEAAKDPSRPISLDNMEFVVGKYYYLYDRGFMNAKQREYFENNRDSLVCLRGDNLTIKECEDTSNY